MLEKWNETIFQMKDTMDVSFKELQLNIDSILKSHVIYKKPSLKTVHTETNKTSRYTLMPDGGCRKAKLPKTIGPKQRYHHNREIALDPE